MVFVADMGQRQVFTKFRISDSYNYQGNALNYQIYTAEEYSGARHPMEPRGKRQACL